MALQAVGNPFCFRQLFNIHFMTDNTAVIQNRFLLLHIQRRIEAEYFGNVEGSVVAIIEPAFLW